MSTLTVGRVARQIVAHPSGILLVVQLLGVLLYPLMEPPSALAQESSVGRVLFEIFGALVLGLAIWSVRTSVGTIWLPIALGITASVLSIVDAFVASPLLQVLAAVGHALFYFWAGVDMMIYMLRDSVITRDELYAVGATFTLLAWAFAYVFQFLQLVQPGCWGAAVNPEEPRTWMELLFLSFTNLTSTGLSDVIPLTPYARAVVMIQQLCGVGYVALFVSRLVGLTVARQRMQ